MNRRVFSAALVCAVLLLTSLSALSQTKRALLIGINTYSPEYSGVSQPQAPAPDDKPHRPDSRFGGPTVWRNLEGPEHDVESMSAILPSFGFTEIHQLLGQRATRAEIMSELDQYMIEESNAGDTVLFYFAGHGSQRLNSKSSKLDHLDETIVPADAYKGAFDIRDKELARTFNRAIEKKVRLIAIFDSCHSGTMARGAAIAVSRWLPYDDRDAADAGDFGSNGKPQAYPPAKRGAIIISAALSTQTADEVAEERSGEVHGVFTSAFVRALRSSTPAWTALDLVNSTDAILQADGWAQRPTVEGPSNRPLFGEFSVGSVRGSVVDLKPPDQVTLNVGSGMALGPDSEFESTEQSGPKLKIVQILGPASSRATITRGKFTDVKVGDLFQLTRFAVPIEAKLTVFVPGVAADDEWSKMTEQVVRMRSGNGWLLVNDPAVDPPTNLVYWTSAGWRMTAPDGEPVTLGSTLTSDSISAQAQNQPRMYKQIQHGIKVFISVPPTRAMVEAFNRQTGIQTGAIEISDSLAASQYMLAGRPASGQSGGAEYSLILRGVFRELDPNSFVRSEVNNHTVICSTNSEMPLRTDWVSLGTKSGDAASAANDIENAALTLGRNRAWLKIGAHNGAESWPYRLAITQPDSDQPWIDDENNDLVLKSGAEYDVSLIADTRELATRPVTPHYVYLFGLQCDGEGRLLYPPLELGGGAPLPLLLSDEKGNRYPAKITLLPHVSVSPPVGRDTIIALVTPERIPDLSAFSYVGVLSRGMESRGVGASGELEELVRGIGGQARGIGSVSTTWSVQKASIKSQ